MTFAKLADRTCRKESLAAIKLPFFYLKLSREKQGQDDFCFEEEKMTLFLWFRCNCYLGRASGDLEGDKTEEDSWLMSCSTRTTIIDDIEEERKGVA